MELKTELQRDYITSHWILSINHLQFLLDLNQDWEHELWCFTIAFLEASLSLVYF